jgi:cell division protein ZipA
MTALQWALLVLSVAIVLAVVVISRRERGHSRRRGSKRRSSRASSSSRSGAFKVPAPAVEREQLDIFDAGSGPQPEPPAREEKAVPTATPAAASLIQPTLSQFDEFGVGRPRKRTAPSLEPRMEEDKPVPPPEAPIAPWLKAPAPDAETEPELPSVADYVGPASVEPDEAIESEPAPPPEPPRAPPPSKIVSLLLVDPSGSGIQGVKLHSSLSAKGLTFGLRQIYHRMVRDQAVFSVASLVKPGVLMPEAAADFATPGLQLFMVLPGPVKPLNALHDMLATAQALSRALNVQVFDARKQPLTQESMRGLQAEVEEWAKAAGL